MSPSCVRCGHSKAEHWDVNGCLMPCWSGVCPCAGWVEPEVAVEPLPGGQALSITCVCGHDALRHESVTPPDRIHDQRRCRDCPCDDWLEAPRNRDLGTLDDYL